MESSVVDIFKEKRTYVQFYSICPNAQHVKQGSKAEWGAAQGADWRKAQSGSDLRPVRSSAFTHRQFKLLWRETS